VNLSPLSGMSAADLLLSATADNTANLDTPDYHAKRVDLATAATGGVTATVSRAPDAGVDLVEQMTNLVTASVVYQANARVLRTAMDTDRAVLDILA
jgi:flagellar hook-associated protein FlgK